MRNLNSKTSLAVAMLVAAFVQFGGGRSSEPYESVGHEAGRGSGVVQFSFNEEIVPVVSEGGVYNIPRAVFRALYGEPITFRAVELVGDNRIYRVYDGTEDAKASIAKEEAVRPLFYNYGGLFFADYGKAFTYSSGEPGSGRMLYSWSLPDQTTRKVSWSGPGRGLASVELTEASVVLVDDSGFIRRGQILSGVDSNVRAFDDGTAIHWLRKSTETSQSCYTGNEVVWSAKSQ